MRYALLIYGDEEAEAQMTQEAWDELIAAHRRFSAEARERGTNVGGEALQPTSTAQTVRFENNKPTTTTDGPYAETREQLGGFYLLDCESMEEVVELAKKLPMMPRGAVEVRPVIEFD